MVGNCPNCGAWVNSNKWEWCGTIFIDEQELKDRIDKLKQEKIRLEYELFNKQAIKWVDSRWKPY